MGYFNYHAKAKNLIKQGHLTNFEFVEEYNKISPALVLYFEDGSKMPIREHRFAEYVLLINIYFNCEKNVKET